MAEGDKDVNRVKFIELLLSFTKNLFPGGELKDLPNPTGVAIFIRGLASWHNDATFKFLEQLVPKLGIRPKRYSYNGPETTYINTDTVGKPLKTLCGYLDEFVNSSAPYPIYLLGHSYGGIVIVNWVCDPDNTPRGLTSVSRIFLFASTLFPSVRFFSVKHEKLGEVTIPLVLHDARRILHIFPNVTVIACEDDAIAHLKETSLQPHVPAGLKANTFEQIIIPIEKNPRKRAGELSHLTICNHDKSIETVRRWLGNVDGQARVIQPTA